MFECAGLKIAMENAEEYLKENLSEEEFAIVSGNSSEIEFKFKIVEMINQK